DIDLVGPFEADVLQPDEHARAGRSLHGVSLQELGQELRGLGRGRAIDGPFLIEEKALSGEQEEEDGDPHARHESVMPLVPFRQWHWHEHLDGRSRRISSRVSTFRAIQILPQLRALSGEIQGLRESVTQPMYLLHRFGAEKNTRNPAL